MSDGAFPTGSGAPGVDDRVPHVDRHGGRLVLTRGDGNRHATGVAVGRPPALPAALDAALSDGEGRLYGLPTYTAMLELRAELHRRGHVGRFWAGADRSAA